MLNKILTVPVFIGIGAAKKLMNYIQNDFSGKKPFVICDVNTEKYANEYFDEYSKYVYPDRQHATPEAAALSRSRIEKEKSGVLIACGSGSIHDITRYNAAELGLPLISFPTAASVDGFASSMAAMTINGQKLTVPAKAPVALFAEPEVLCDAPSVLSLSGIGDILGKYVCIFDWKVANLLTGERYDPYIEKMERDAIKGLIETDYHDKAFVSKLMECLVLSGIAIQQFGNTRPASGAEHHLSHFWEMHCANPETDALHGEQVGVSTIILLDLYKSVSDLKLTKKPLTREFLSPVFKDLTDGIIKENIPFIPDTITQEKLNSVWKEIRHLAETELPDAKFVSEFLASKGGKTTLSDLGLPSDNSFLAATLRYSPYVRNRLTLLKLL